MYKGFDFTLLSSLIKLREPEFLKSGQFSLNVTPNTNNLIFII